MKNKYLFVVLLLAILLAGGLAIAYAGYKSSNAPAEGSAESSTENLKVVTSFHPMYIAAENVIGDAEGVELVNMTGEQTGCLHNYQMTTEDMKKLADADVFIINGGGIESFLETVAEQYPKLTIVETGESLEAPEEEPEDATAADDTEEAHEHEEGAGEEKAHEHEESDAVDSHEHGEGAEEDSHEHGEDEEEAHAEHGHVHGEENAHYWMDPEKYLVQIRTLAEGLSSADPQRAETYRANAERYEEKVQSMIDEEKELRQKTADRPVVIFHEAFEYLAESLGMRIAAALDLDEERQVSANELAGILSAIRNEDVDMVFAEELYGEETGQIVEKETDAEVLYLDTLVRGSYDADAWLKGMRRNLEQIRGGLS